MAGKHVIIEGIEVEVYAKCFRIIGSPTVIFLGDATEAQFQQIADMIIAIKNQQKDKIAQVLGFQR